MQSQNSARIIRRIESASRLGISIATLDRMVRTGRIKPPTKIGERSSGWPESYIDDFIAGKLTQGSNPQITSTK